MVAAGTAPTPRPPGRALPRLAGAITQLACGVCLLIGTIGLVLVQQNKVGSLATLAIWLAAAMAGLVFGGLIYRGGLVNLLIAAVIDAGFGVALVTLDAGLLHALLKILPPSDVDTIGGALAGVGYALFAASALCLVALPQGIRYARWFRSAAERTATSTVRGFPPPPVPARGSVYVTRDAPAKTRRRLYTVLGGLAIGVGAGIGILVTSTSGPAKQGGGSGSAGSAASAVVSTRVLHDAGVEAVPAVRDAAVALADAATIQVATPTPTATLQGLLAAQSGALAKADAKALAELIIPTAFGFGVNADEVAEDREAVIAQLLHDLGEPPADGFTVQAKLLSSGEERGHAWLAEDIEVASGSGEPRHYAVTELAAVVDGAWRFVALHWASPVDDATAERLAILATLPAPKHVIDHSGGSGLDAAVRAAFASRAAFADARSERADAFNLGSGGERVKGGTAIKRVFSKIKAQIRQHDGARVVTGGSWDPAQRTDPWIGWAAVNVDFTAKTKALTEVTQTFRVLAIFVKEDASWKIVQTQWSNGGPIH